MGRNLKESGRGLIEVLSGDYIEGAEENYEELQLGWSIFMPRFELTTYRIKVYSVIARPACMACALLKTEIKLRDSKMWEMY
jgi:hypothetical protein